MIFFGGLVRSGWSNSAHTIRFYNATEFLPLPVLEPSAAGRFSYPAPWEDA